MESRGHRLVTILHEPEPVATYSTALIIVVGGPQYRVGSHRQFVQLARALAARGIVVVRFDYTGMGDSDGPETDFLDVGPDVAAMVAWTRRRQPDISEIALWGLCDGASAAVLFGSDLPGVTGLCLVNPWVRSDTSAANARVKAYYLVRLRSLDFWQRLLSGQVNPTSFVGDLVKTATGWAGKRMEFADKDRQPETKSTTPTESTFVEIMRARLERFHGRVLIILSSDDLTASEFRITALENKRWRKAVSAAQVMTLEADHTFSTEESKRQIAHVTENWLAVNDSKGNFY